MTTSTASPSAPATPLGSRTGAAGFWSLRLGLIAFAGAAIATLVSAGTMVPMQAAHGRFFTDTPGAYQVAVIVLGMTMLVWTALGIASIITGARALAQGHDARRATWGIALSVAAPVVAFIILIGGMLVGALLL